MGFSVSIPGAPKVDDWSHSSSNVRMCCCFLGLIVRRVWRIPRVTTCFNHLWDSVYAMLGESHLWATLATWLAALPCKIHILMSMVCLKDLHGMGWLKFLHPKWYPKFGICFLDLRIRDRCLFIRLLGCYPSWSPMIPKGSRRSSPHDSVGLENLKAIFCAEFMDVTLVLTCSNHKWDF